MSRKAFEEWVSNTYAKHTAYKVLSPTSGAWAAWQAATNATLAAPATAPSWHDAPTVPGVWFSDGGYENPYRWTPHIVKDPAHEREMRLPDERWYGPIPEDKP